MAPAVSQDSIDPQLLQTPTKRPALSSIMGEHTTSAADGHSIGNPSSSSKHEESEINDDDAATGQDSAENGQNAPQVHAAVQTVPGVGRLATIHGDLGDMHAGYRSYMRARRTLTIDNDDYHVLTAYNTYHVRKVYNAITTHPTSMTANQTRMVAFWGKKLNVLGNDADQYMADLASMVVAGVWTLHVNGDHLFDTQFKSLKPHKDDSTMTATERVHTICKILYNYKKHVIDLMAGFDAVTKLVAAPKGIAKRKEEYKSNNDHKATNLTELRAAAKPAKKKVEDEDEDDD
ncbi:hypothetical protein MBLNU13_g04030t1 [Cladosporium sp. NU13]